MKETLIMVVLGAGSVCVAFMFSRLRTFRVLKRRTIVDKIRRQGF